MTKRTTTRKPKVAGVGIERGIVYGDVHDPYADEAVWRDLFVPAVKLIKPDFLVELGDGFDFFSCSPFAKDPARKMSLAADRDTFVARRKELGKVLPPKCRKWYVPGNHEKWLHRYIWSHAEELACLPELKWHEFLKLRELGYQWMDFDGEQMPILDIGNLALTHGNVARKPLGGSLRAMLDEYGQNIMFNHTHRMGWLPMTNHSVEIGGWENGCLCKKALGHEYIKGSVRWQQGFSIVTLYEDGDFRVHMLHIVKHGSRKRLYLNEGILECAA